MTRNELFKKLLRRKHDTLAWALSGVIEALYTPNEDGDLQKDSEWSSDTPVDVHMAVQHVLPSALLEG
jgi:hypothetical protein